MTHDKERTRNQIRAFVAGVILVPVGFGVAIDSAIALLPSGSYTNWTLMVGALILGGLGIPLAVKGADAVAEAIKSPPPSVDEIALMGLKEYDEVRILVATISAPDPANPVPGSIVHSIAKFRNLELIVALVSDQGGHLAIPGFVTSLKGAKQPPAVEALDRPVVAGSMWDISDLSGSILKRLEAHGKDLADGGVYADVTGGSKPMTLSLYLAARQLEIPVLYCSAEKPPQAAPSAADVASMTPKFGKLYDPVKTD